MLPILGLVATVVSILLMMIILVQRGKGGGLTGALGGMGGQSAFGAKAGDVFTRVTVIAAIIWMTACLLIIRIYNRPPAAPQTANTKNAALSGFIEDGPSDGGIDAQLQDPNLGLGTEETDPVLSEDPDDENDFNPGLETPADGTTPVGGGDFESRGEVDPNSEADPMNEDPTIEGPTIEGPAIETPTIEEPGTTEAGTAETNPGMPDQDPVTESTEPAVIAPGSEPGIVDPESSVEPGLVEPESAVDPLVEEIEVESTDGN